VFKGSKKVYPLKKPSPILKFIVRVAPYVILLCLSFILS